MAKIFTIINNKGGTGKTTTTVNLGAALALEGKKCLLIDLDSQCNLSTSLGITDAEIHAGHLLLSVNKPMECVLPTNRENLFVVPSSVNLLDYETKINNEPGREYLLKENLQNVENNFEYIFIDCPPSLGTLSINALVASRYFIVPMQAENFAFIGLDKILDITAKVKNRMNPNLELGGILFVRQSLKTKFSMAVISSISENEKLSGKMLQTIIRQDISLMEASAFSQTVFEYAPKSRGAADYKDLATELTRLYG